MNKLKINIITLFPNLFTEHIKNLPFKKAIEKDLMEVTLVNLRDFALDSYGTVDDKPYGGGVGMVLMVEPIFTALQKLGVQKGQPNKKILLLTPTGKKFNQKIARDYIADITSNDIGKLTEITFICGRYEGIDYRVQEQLVDQSISIGDYVLSGGELAALVVMEALTRLLPGILEKADAAAIESFSNEQTDNLEYPQYTRPENFNGMTVPKVLLSGNHKEIDKWKKEQSKTLPTSN